MENIITFALGVLTGAFSAIASEYLLAPLRRRERRISESESRKRAFRVGIDGIRQLIMTNYPAAHESSKLEIIRLCSEVRYDIPDARLTEFESAKVAYIGIDEQERNREVATLFKERFAGIPSPPKGDSPKDIVFWALETLSDAARE